MTKESPSCVDCGSHNLERISCKCGSNIFFKNPNDKVVCVQCGTELKDGSTT